MKSDWVIDVDLNPNHACVHVCMHMTMGLSNLCIPCPHCYVACRKCGAYLSPLRVLDTV